MSDRPCPYHKGISEDLGEIKTGIIKIQDQIAEGAVDIGTTKFRVGFLEKALYGGVGVALLAIGVAVIKSYVGG